MRCMNYGKKETKDRRFVLLSLTAAMLVDGYNI
jgi:hypothetical protein